jgi:hypothetical protein
MRCLMDRDVLEFGGMLVFFVCLFINRWIGERALAALDASMKVRLVDGFAKQRMFGLLPVIGLTVLAFLLFRYFSAYPAELLLVFILLSFATIAGTTIIAFRNLSRLGMPREYVKSYILGRALTFAGMGGFVACSILAAIQS